MRRSTPAAFGPFTSLAFLALLALLAGPVPVAAVDIDDTRLLAEPDLSATHVAFRYAGDLWIAELAAAADGGARARRLTSHPGIERRPRFSPDGRWLAFTGEYDGNTDVYVVPSAGGEPRRLTWHPAEDVAWDFTPDSRAVLFGSPRAASNRGIFHLFAVDLEGGFLERLEVPTAFYAALSPDGARVAYNPLPPAFDQWKHYRGGRVSRIWLQDLDDHAVEQVPQPADRSNDTDPMWLDGRIVFRSDRGGEFNLWAYDLTSREVAQLTEHDEFPVLAAASGGGRIVYEQAGWLHLYDPAAGASRRLRIGVAADLVAARPRWVGGAQYLRNMDLSPSGARAVFEFRGEIVTVPAKKGDVRQLTSSPGAHDRSPVWSADGQQIAWLCDATGEYTLQVAPQNGRGTPRTFELEGAGFYTDPRFSPDGTKLSYLDNSWALRVLDLESGEIDLVTSERYYGPERTRSQSHAWSPDSRWLATTRSTGTYFRQVLLYSVAERRSRVITDGLADVGEPVFDAGGKYLYFTASTDAGPRLQWFAMSNVDKPVTHGLYLAVLPSGVVSPLAKESDEEGGADGDEDTAEPGTGGEDGDETANETRVEIDFEGLDQRIVALPADEAYLWDLQAGSPGELYYLRAGAPPSFFGEAVGDLVRFDLETRQAETVLAGVSRYALSGDRRKILVQAKGEWSIADAGAKMPPGEGRLATDAIEVRIEPRAEWEQIFHEAWRINRDYFYDPGMHGADWPAMREKYAAFLPHLADRDDLDRVIRWMSSELAVGHHRVGGGDQLWEVEEIAGGLLGADFELDGDRYRFAKVFGGLNWNPDLRAPLTEPGVEVAAGEYLLAIDGRPLDASENVYRRFENTAGKIVELTVGPSADGTSARTVEVVPIESEFALRNRDWVEGNLRRVDEATGGRVAYVYVPNTTTPGHTYFKRYFYPQADREAIIVDERFNGGGQVADYYIDLLRRPRLAYWETRYGETIRTPIAGIQGPKVMLINELAGSGGDLLPWMFRQLGLGPLVGRRTWGGLVGILGFPTLLDGGTVTAPNLAFWTEEEGFGIENVGVPPDVEVEQWPAELAAGRDPQLERAIEVILERLAQDPPPAVPEPPPFPLRARP